MMGQYKLIGFNADILDFNDLFLSRNVVALYQKNKKTEFQEIKLKISVYSV
jgi:hypothetical protein